MTQYDAKGNAMEALWDIIEYYVDSSDVPNLRAEIVANFETVAVAAGGTVRTETNWPKLDSNRLVVEMPWKAVES